MITGAANMDGAIVVVAASDGQMYENNASSIDPLNTRLFANLES